MLTRDVVDRIEDEWEIGHRQMRRDSNSPWRAIPNSRYYRNLRTFWFQKSPRAIMSEDMGFETTTERAAEFSQASDSDPKMWYYLAAAALYGEGEEALKWIMAALATEVKTRSLRFVDIPSLMSANILGLFAKALVDGQIERTFSKAIFSELLATSDPNEVVFQEIISKPEYKAVGEDDLVVLVEKLFVDNPEQVDKARQNPRIAQWFVGQVMKQTGGKAQAQKVLDIVNRKLA